MTSHLTQTSNSLFRPSGFGLCPSKLFSYLLSLSPLSTCTLLALLLEELHEG